MIENRPEERAELETRARWALEHPEQREPRGVVEGFRPMLRLWHYPAFANDISWTVFAPVSRGSETRFIVRKVFWNKVYDMRRFSHPLEWLEQGYRTLPAISTHDAFLPADQLAPFLEELAQYPVPVAGIEAPWGLDGAIFGFEHVASGILRVRLEWWSDGPVEWQPFTRYVARLREMLQQHLEKQA